LSSKLKKSILEKKIKHSILELEGLGAEIWKGIDAPGICEKRERSLGLIDTLRGSKEKAFTI
jgi:hypothetical protein